jgi:tartrate dehydratase beta subunit/fumarate hydratase class I family protein
MEAIRRVEVENFPAFTIIDDKAMTSSRINFFKELKFGVRGHPRHCRA